MPGGPAPGRTTNVASSRSSDELAGPIGSARSRKLRCRTSEPGRGVYPRLTRGPAAEPAPPGRAAVRSSVVAASRMARTAGGGRPRSPPADQGLRQVPGSDGSGPIGAGTSAGRKAGNTIGAASWRSPPDARPTARRTMTASVTNVMVTPSMIISALWMSILDKRPSSRTPSAEAAKPQEGSDHRLWPFGLACLRPMPEDHSAPRSGHLPWRRLDSRGLSTLLPLRILAGLRPIHRRPVWTRPHWPPHDRRPSAPAHVELRRSAIGGSTMPASPPIGRPFAKETRCSPLVSCPWRSEPTPGGSH
jgi:hypothetical protein